MSTDFFILMKSELSITLIIFILLILKVWDGFKDNSTYLHITNVLLLLNFAVGFIYSNEGVLFNGMFHTTTLLVFEKSILNLGTLLISLQAYDWLKTHKHVPEFYLGTSPLFLTIVLSNMQNY